MPWFKEILIPIDEEGLILFCEDEYEDEELENGV